MDTEAVVNWTDFRFDDDGNLCSPRPHPLHGRTVVVCGPCPHIHGNSVCELPDEQDLPAEKRQICSIPDESLSYTDALVSRLSAASPGFRQGFALEKARIGDRPL